MNITPEIVAVIGTLGGTLVGAISTLLVTIIKNQSEERKHFKELIMKSASDNWKYIFENSTSKTMLPYEHDVVTLTRTLNFI